MRVERAPPPAAFDFDLGADLELARLPVVRPVWGDTRILFLDLKKGQ
jgi:hypothetical protein